MTPRCRRRHRVLVAMGLLGGFFPAFRAARLKITTALREVCAAATARLRGAGRRRRCLTGAQQPPAPSFLVTAPLTASAPQSRDGVGAVVTIGDATTAGR
jgi:hypothetical protein